MLTQIGSAVELGQCGERPAARGVLATLWEQVGPAGDPLHRVAIAHAMADLQDDLQGELRWDLQALEAAGSVTDERAADAGSMSAAALYPSLHLNLAEDYRKLGDLWAAWRHVHLGFAVVSALGNDGYGRMIIGALERLAARLADPESPAT
jgi:hypothetical protein